MENIFNELIKRDIPFAVVLSLNHGQTDNFIIAARDHEHLEWMYENKFEYVDPLYTRKTMKYVVMRDLSPREVSFFRKLNVFSIVIKKDNCYIYEWNTHSLRRHIDEIKAGVTINAS